MSVRDQMAFAARIRRPEAEPLLPGISAQRMAVYEELFFNNLDGFVTSGFPVLCLILGEARRRRLVRAFIDRHRGRTPYFLEIGEEFVAWLEAGGGAEAGDPAFLAELAHYERVELALDIACAELPTQGWSPLAWPLAYAWPVHRIGPAFQPDAPPPQPTLLLLRREADGEVRFSELSPLAYRLVERLGESPELSGREQLRALAAEAGSQDIDSFVAQGRALLEQMRASGVVPGTRAHRSA